MVIISEVLGVWRTGFAARRPKCLIQQVTSLD